MLYILICMCKDAEVSVKIACGRRLRTTVLVQRQGNVVTRVFSRLCIDFFNMQINCCFSQRCFVSDNQWKTERRVFGVTTQLSWDEKSSPLQQGQALSTTLKMMSFATKN